MTRLSGIQLVASGIVLWALAVWVFGVPHPEATETAVTAPAETVEKSSAGAGDAARSDATADVGIGDAFDVAHGSGDAVRSDATADVGIGDAFDVAHGSGDAARSDATAVPPSTAQVAQGSTTPPEPDAGVGTPSSQAGPARIGDTASAPSANRVPPAATPEVPGTGGDSRTALAPAGPEAGDPIAPRAPRTGGAPGSLDGLGPPPPPPEPWFEREYSRPPPPARRAMDGGAVASQINSARRAAWEGRLADALAHYRAAARIQANNHVVWGEMGNVLWALRRWSEAAYALEGAATLLIRAGELHAASALVPAVERIDPDAAYRVRRLLWTATQNQAG